MNIITQNEVFGLEMGLEFYSKGFFFWGGGLFKKKKSIFVKELQTFVNKKNVLFDIFIMVCDKQVILDQNYENVGFLGDRTQF